MSEPTQSTNDNDNKQTTTTGQKYLTNRQKLDTATTKTLNIYRHDKQLITRDDIFLIQAEIGTAEIELMETNGTTYHDITDSFRHEHGFTLICNNYEAVKFYQTAVKDIKEDEAGHKGFISYRHDEKRPGHQIIGFVHSTHWKNRDKQNLMFCAGSAGTVKPNQVTQYRQSRQEPSGMIKVFLELDDAAFEWLRSKDWTSRIGGLTVPRRAPNLPGLTGIYRPDEDVHAIKAALVESYNNFNPSDIPKTDSTSTPNTGLSQTIDQLDVNSVNTSEALATDDEDIATDSDKEADTTVRPQTPSGAHAMKMDTPRKLPPAKIRRSRTVSGGYMSDVSSTENHLD